MRQIYVHSRKHGTLLDREHSFPRRLSVPTRQASRNVGRSWRFRESLPNFRLTVSLQNTKIHKSKCWKRHVERRVCKTNFTGVNTTGNICVRRRSILNVPQRSRQGSLRRIQMYIKKIRVTGGQNWKYISERKRGTFGWSCYRRIYAFNGFGKEWSFDIVVSFDVRYACLS